MTSYGGIWETAIKECYADEFEKRTGHKANVLIGSPAQWMSQIEANPGRSADPRTGHHRAEHHRRR